MIKTYMDICSVSRPSNELVGIDKDLKLKMTPQTIEHLKEIRLEYKNEYVKADSALKDITNNKRLKNKNASFTLIVERAKNYFNYRAFDYYMYRIGFKPLSGEDISKEGIEYQLYELKKELNSMLHTFGKYEGYNMIHWIYGDGCNEWFKDGEPDWTQGKEKYVREDLGVFYY